MSTPARQPPADADVDVAGLADDLEALSSQQRLSLLHFLTRPRYGEEIAEHLGMTRQAATKHVARLEERGFVRALAGRRLSGPVTEYQVVPQRIFALSLSLNELARLEPVGGPIVQKADPTVLIDDRATTDAPTAPAARTARLVVLESPSAGRPLLLEPSRDRWTAGREKECDVQLAHDPYASARHVEIRRAGDLFEVVDLFSANGTFLNFARIPRGGRAPFGTGDILTVGRTMLVLQTT